LRFPEFSGEWENTELQYIAPNICSGKDKPTSNGTVALYGSTGIIGMTRLASYNEEIVLVARVGANAGQLQITTIPCGVTDNTLIINAKEWNRYIYYYLQHYNLNRLVFGSGQPLITGSMLKKLKIIYGEESERNKIVNLLCLLDERIATQNKIIEKLQSLIKGLAVALTTKEKANIAISQCLECHSSTLQESEVLSSGLCKVFGANGLVGYKDVPQMNGDAILVIKDGSGVGTVSYAQGLP
jgi:type I restriction enzyme, S subunit